MSGRCFLSCQQVIGNKKFTFLQRLLIQQTLTGINRCCVLKPNNWGMLHKQTKHLGCKNSFHISKQPVHVCSSTETSDELWLCFCVSLSTLKVSRERLSKSSDSQPFCCSFTSLYFTLKENFTAGFLTI